MKRRTLILSAAVTLMLTACAVDESEPAVASASENVREEDIEYRLWAEPAELSLAGSVSGQVAYGQCEQVEPEPGTDIQIECGQAWSEVAWYAIEAEQVQAALDEGRSQLGIDIALANADAHPRVRLSVHRVAEDGSRQKLASQSMLFDGDRLEVSIEQPGELYVYVAKGRSPWPLWSNGIVDFELTPAFE
jgi:hypothetical protein